MKSQPPLPSSWVEKYTADGKVYYQNNITKSTQWELPSALAPTRDDEKMAQPKSLATANTVPQFTSGHEYYLFAVNGLKSDRKFLSCSMDGRTVNLAAGDDLSACQRWLISNVGMDYANGYGVYHVESKAAGATTGRKFLSSDSSGKNMSLLPNDDFSGRQRWVFIPLGVDVQSHRPIFNIRVESGTSANSVFLDCAADGTSMKLQGAVTGNSGEWQRWTLVSCDLTMVNGLTSGSSYNLYAVNGLTSDRRFLSCSADRKTVALATGDDQSGRQKWVFTNVAMDHTKGHGVYQLAPKAGVSVTRFMSSTDALNLLSSDKTGKHMSLEPDDDLSGRQRWVFMPAGVDPQSQRAVFHIRVKNGTKAKRVFLDSEADGSKVKLHCAAHEDQAGWQRWVVIPCDKSQGAAPAAQKVAALQQSSSAAVYASVAGNATVASPVANGNTPAAAVTRPLSQRERLAKNKNSIVTPPSGPAAAAVPRMPTAASAHQAKNGSPAPAKRSRTKRAQSERIAKKKDSTVTPLKGEAEDEKKSEEVVVIHGLTSGKTYNLFAVARLKGERKFLSCSANAKIVDLEDGDDLSGRQQWVMTNVGMDGQNGVYNMTVKAGLTVTRNFLTSDKSGKNIGLAYGDDESGRARWVCMPAGVDPKSQLRVFNIRVEKGTEKLSLFSNKKLEFLDSMPDGSKAKLQYMMTDAPSIWQRWVVVPVSEENEAVDPMKLTLSEKLLQAGFFLKSKMEEGAEKLFDEFMSQMNIMSNIFAIAGFELKKMDVTIKLEPVITCKIMNIDDFAVWDERRVRKYEAQLNGAGKIILWTVKQASKTKQKLNEGGGLVRLDGYSFSFPNPKLTLAFAARKDEKKKGKGGKGKGKEEEDEDDEEEEDDDDDE